MNLLNLITFCTLPSALEILELLDFDGQVLFVEYCETLNVEMNGVITMP